MLPVDFHPWFINFIGFFTVQVCVRVFCVCTPVWFFVYLQIIPSQMVYFLPHPISVLLLLLIFIQQVINSTMCYYVCFAPFSFKKIFFFTSFILAQTLSILSTLRLLVQIQNFYLVSFSFHLRKFFLLSYVVRSLIVSLHIRYSPLFSAGCFQTILYYLFPAT